MTYIDLGVYFGGFLTILAVISTSYALYLYHKERKEKHQR